VQEALEKALAELALAQDFSVDDDQALRAWLTRHRVSPVDTEHLIRQGPRRLLTYRRLVRGTLREAIELTLPRVVARLGPVFDEYFARFLAERAPRTHYLRDVTPEFLEFCAPDWACDARVAPYLLELADHEALQLEIAAMQARPKGHVADELELDAGVVFVDACRIVHYFHAIHELSESTEARETPRSESTWLFVYRNPDHEVRTLKLTPLAAAILSRLLELQETLRKAVLNACAEHEVPVTQDVLSGTATLLADLSERGALLGKAPRPTGHPG